MFADLQSKAKEHSATCVATSQWVHAKSQSANDFNNLKRTTVAQSGKEVEDMAKSNFVLYPDANSFAPIASTTKGCIVDLTLLMDALAADLAAAPGRLPIQPSAMGSMKASAEAAWETLIATGYERLTDTAKVFAQELEAFCPSTKDILLKEDPDIVVSEILNFSGNPAIPFLVAKAASFCKAMLAFDKVILELERKNSSKFSKGMEAMKVAHDALDKQDEALRLRLFAGHVGAVVLVSLKGVTGDVAAAVKAAALKKLRKGKERAKEVGGAWLVAQLD